ncbi:hypothetical protein [Streptomyces sp. NPDC052701]|uniref:hypothetical protein n=1 Tax=Streptomyces sp. NPDC052701 TaxID=3155533 RepID=UPI00342866AA
MARIDAADPREASEICTVKAVAKVIASIPANFLKAGLVVFTIPLPFGEKLSRFRLWNHAARNLPDRRLGSIAITHC